MASSLGLDITKKIWMFFCCRDAKDAIRQTKGGTMGFYIIRNACAASALMLSSSTALADDDIYTYRISVVNQTGEAVSVVCTDANPRPLPAQQVWTFNFVGPDDAVLECTAHDHHGEPIASSRDVLGHHHLSHTVILRRGSHPH